MGARADKDSPFMDKQGIADRYGVSLRTVTNMCSRGEIPYIHIGRSIRFNVRACDDALQAKEVKSIGQLMKEMEMKRV